MSTVLGIDPGSDYTGLAWMTLGADGRPRLLHLVAVRLGTAPVERLAAALHSGPVAIDRVVVERAPKTARADTGRGKVQGTIGWGLGFSSGLALGLALHHSAQGPFRTPHLAVEPSEWRPAMLAASARAGKLLQAPRRAPGWSPDDVRDAWKATACTYVGHAFPTAFQALVDDARARARTATHAWQLAGVPDACEAVGIALYGLATPKGPLGRAMDQKAARALSSVRRRGR